MLLRLAAGVSFLLLTSTTTRAQSSCGREAIPYLISVDLAGKPACFGPLRSPLIDDTLDDSTRELNALQRTAACSGHFTDIPCAGPDEWTGGVAEFNNGTHISLTMECCRFEGLNYATEYKVALVRPGERYVGGPVKEQGRLIAFDLIKEVRKNVNQNNEIHYVVNIYRMSCVPAPTRLTNNVDPTMTTGEYLTKKLSAKSRVPFRRTEYNGRMHRHRPVYYDYDYYSYERPVFRRRPGGFANHGRNGPRRFHRPLDDYEYYDHDPRAHRRRPLNNKHSDVLWPIEDEKRNSARKLAKAHGQKNLDGVGDYPSGDAQKADELPSSYGNAEHENTVTLVPQRDPYIASYPQPEPTLVLPAPSQDTYAISVQQSNGYVASPAQSYALQPSASYIQSPASYSPSSYPASSYPASSYPSSSYSSSYDSTYSSGSCSSGCCTASCSMNSMFSTMQCFSEDMVVETPSGPKTMKQLNVGDMVMSIDGSLVTYAKVVMFLHRKPEDQANYTTIVTESGAELKITANHLMYRTSCKAGERLKLIKAGDVRVGDCVHLSRNRNGLKQEQVVDVRMIPGFGIYAPLTTSGDMFVNGVLVSCHSNLAAQTLQQTFFSFWRQWAQPVQNLLSYVLPADLLPDKGVVNLPFGVEYLTTVVDMFIPQTMLS